MRAPRTAIAVLALVAGCATSQRSTVTTGPGGPTAPSATTTVTLPPEVPGTRAIGGDGWAARVPAGWTQSVDTRGVTLWTAPVAEGLPEHRAFSVEMVRGPETFEQMVSQIPAAYQARGGTSEHRLRDVAGRRAAEFDVRFAPHVLQLPMYFLVLVEGRSGVVVTCGGEPAEGLERSCRETLASAWFGPNASARPRGPAAEGRAWAGAHGRYVQVPVGWRPMTGHSAPQGDAMGVADDGEHHAIVLNFLDGLTLSPADAVAAARANFARDTANSLVHEEPVHEGRRVGVAVDAVRAMVTSAASTLVQWIVPAGPGAFFTVNCAGTSEDMAEHPDVCRGVMSTFTPTSHP